VALGKLSIMKETLKPGEESGSRNTHSKNENPPLRDKNRAGRGLINRNTCQLEEKPPDDINQAECSDWGGKLRENWRGQRGTFSAKWTPTRGKKWHFQKGRGTVKGEYSR